MKQNTSLEDERRALLDQIHSSREIYRRMLTKSDKSQRTIIEGRVVNASTVEHFPRSMTMRWIVQNPYLAGAAATAVVALLGSRRTRTAIVHGTTSATQRLRGKSATMRPVASSDIAAPRRTARTRITDFPASSNTSKPMTIARSVFTGLATAAAMVLRDPRKMRTATNAFSAAAGFIRARRSRRPEKGHVQVVHVKEG